MTEEFLLLKDAMKYLGISKAKIWRLVKEGALPTYSDPLDKRKRLVRKEDIEKLRQPRPQASH